MIKRNDIILIGIILLAAFIFVVIFQVTKSEGAKVLITVDGKEYKTLDLDKDTSFTIPKENGGENIVLVEDGKVSMEQADCPDKLCVKHKSIQYNHETIVCLPHKVVVEIIGGEENDVDMNAD